VSEESTTPDLVDLGSRFFEAANRRDFDAMISFFAPHAVWEGMALRTTLKGVAAIRGFWQEWFGSYEDWEIEPEQVLDLGDGVGFAVIRQHARPIGSTGRVQTQMAFVSEWVDGLIERITFYLDIDEARAAAERLAAERLAQERG
jgi:ketosteroid isomerase-like protein